jgi:hypothetical protein
MSASRDLRQTIPRKTGEAGTVDRQSTSASLDSSMRREGRIRGCQGRHDRVKIASSSNSTECGDTGMIDRQYAIVVRVLLCVIPCNLHAEAVVIQEKGMAALRGLHQVIPHGVRVTVVVDRWNVFIVRKLPRIYVDSLQVEGIIQEKATIAIQGLRQLHVQI